MRLRASRTPSIGRDGQMVKQTFRASLASHNHDPPLNPVRAVQREGASLLKLDAPATLAASAELGPIQCALMSIAAEATEFSFPTSPSAWDRRPFARRDRGAARPFRSGHQAQPSSRQEARRPPRPHPDQSFLRGLDPDAKLLRARRQTARRRRDEHVGPHLVGAQGRDPDRHGGDAERHAPRHSRGAPSCGRRGRAARAEGRLLGDQCRRRQP